MLNIKLPDFKFKLPRLKMNDIEDVGELKVDIEKLKEKQEKQEKLKKGEHYKPTRYKTVKDIYLHSMETFANEVFILDKDNPKDEKFKEWTYREFGNDVEALGTALITRYNVKDERIVIIGENQYGWYVSYMACY